jgi:hypothetical protein
MNSPVKFFLLRSLANSAERLPADISRAEDENDIVYSAFRGPVTVAIGNKATSSVVGPWSRNIVLHGQFTDNPVIDSVQYTHTFGAEDGGYAVEFRGTPEELSVLELGRAALHMYKTSRIMQAAGSPE